MADNQRRILEMLADGKISVDEAHKLLTLVEPLPGAQSDAPTSKTERRGQRKYLHVVVQPDSEGEQAHKAERVNVRVPLSLIRAGMKLTALIPSHAANHVNEALREKGIDFDLHNIKAGDLEELVDALSDLEVDIQSSKEEKVHVYVE